MILRVKNDRVQSKLATFRGEMLCRLPKRRVRKSWKLSLIKHKHHLSLCLLLWIRRDYTFLFSSTPSMMSTKQTNPDYKGYENSSTDSDTYDRAYSNRLGAWISICIRRSWRSFKRRRSRWNIGWRRRIIADWWTGSRSRGLAVKLFIEVVGIVVRTILVGGIFFCKRFTWTKV